MEFWHTLYSEEIGQPPLYLYSLGGGAVLYYYDYAGTLRTPCNLICLVAASSAHTTQ